jgi:N-methylhydantoinase A
MMPDRHYRIGIDIGGTFTDLVMVGADGTVATHKVSSTVDDFSRGIMVGLTTLLEEQGVRPSDIGTVVHGTTVATNAILEGTGARTALITTAGFRDVLELRRSRIPELYNLFYQKPAPLVPRRLRIEVIERVGANGEVRRPLDAGSVAAAVERLCRDGVEAVAVCLLHSYANPAHERAVARAIAAHMSDVFLSCSVDVLPEIREYERTSTTVINAYVGPLVKHYLRSLLTKFQSVSLRAPLLLMQSAGGVMTAEAAMIQPAHIIESGPAAGVIASVQLARRTGHANIITLDMGGTTAKASIIENGEAATTSEYEVGAGITLSSRLVKGGGYALKLPVLDISEIGAGGGSIVSVDSGGLLQIGPRSAGAVPGPACYGTGGEEPTLTDALVTLGYLNPEYLAGGRVRLNAHRARRAVAERVAAVLGKPLLETAYGIYAIASATMMRAVKAVSTFRGRDPRDFVLLAFGGNGAAMAAEMIRVLEMQRALIPPHPGLFSAFGLLQSNIEHQLVQTCFRRLGAARVDEINSQLAALQARMYEALSAQGIRPGQVTLRRSADLRYSGQAFELTIPLPLHELTAEELAELPELFGAEHLRTYGQRAADEPLDLVNLRLSGTVATAPLPLAEALPPATHEVRRRVAYFGSRYGQRETPVIERRHLTGRPIPGPLIIEEYDATCVVPPDFTAQLDAWHNIVVEVR